MWNADIPAFIYVIFAGLAASVQIALVFGSPLGRLTLAGRWRGVLPPAIRMIAALQALLLTAMAIAILERAGLTAFHWPAWTYWSALTLTGISLLGNSISPSLPERRLWTPVLAIMLLAGAGV